MTQTLYEWSMQHNKWISKRTIEVDPEYVEQVIANGIVFVKDFYKIELSDGRVFLTANSSLFDNYKD